MVISHSKKFIFIHVWKVAGSSVRKAFESYNNETWRASPKLDMLKIALGFSPKIYSKDFRGHITTQELKEKLPAKIFESYFKFAFVRNPWDWQVSLYHFMLENKNHWQYEQVKGYSFEQYIHWRITNDIRFQKDFIYDAKDEKCLIDFVGKYETLQIDLDKICQHINIPQLQLPHINKSKHKDYRFYYTTETIDLVAEAFQKDIDTFGYTFE